MLYSTRNVNCTHKFGHSYFDETETSSLSSKKTYKKKDCNGATLLFFKVMGLAYKRTYVKTVTWQPNFLTSIGYQILEVWSSARAQLVRRSSAITRVFDYLIFCLKVAIKSFFIKWHCYFLREIVMPMLIGNRTSYRPILSVIILVINKSDSSLAAVRLCQYSYDYKPNLNTINNKNSYFCRLSIKLL